jgi:hypothetical protein
MGGGKGGEMTQTLYEHMRKEKKRLVTKTNKQTKALLVHFKCIREAFKHIIFLPSHPTGRSLKSWPCAC